ncbi:MAG: hypothetical protein ACJ732_00270 [Rubrobacteraceae bacterium]
MQRMGLETEQLAWVVLHTANRTQSKGSTVRLLVPRAPEVIDEMGIEPTEERMVAVEDYLLEQGYVSSVDMGLSRGTYTITAAGLRWLEGRPPQLLEVLEKATRDMEWWLLASPRGGDQERATERPWWEFWR